MTAVQQGPGEEPGQIPVGEDSRKRDTPGKESRVGQSRQCLKNLRGGEKKNKTKSVITAKLCKKKKMSTKKYIKKVKENKGNVIVIQKQHNSLKC